MVSILYQLVAQQWYCNGTSLKWFSFKTLGVKIFIDDIFMIWTHGEESLGKFINYYKSLNQILTCVCGAYFSLVGTTVKLNGNDELIRALLNKSTGNHLYLHHFIAHPSSVLEKGLFPRIRRSCPLYTGNKDKAYKLTGCYLKGYYPTKTFKNHYLRVNSHIMNPSLSQRKMKLTHL